MGTDGFSGQADRPGARELRVPASAADVTGSWVRACLGLGGRTSHVAAVERLGEGFGLSSVLLRVRLPAPDAPPRSVVVKLWSTDAAPADRESRVLRALARRPGPRAPVCHYHEVDYAAGRAVAVLEDLGDVDQGDALEQLPAEPAARMASALAALHALWWGAAEGEGPGDVPRCPWLGLAPEWFPDRVGTALARFGDRLGASARVLLERVGEVYPRAMARLEAAPTTLLHDDLHLDNVVFDRATREPILLDWARASMGPAALDVAELLVMVAAPGQADGLLAAYRRELLGRGVDPADVDGIEGAVAAAVVVTFVKGTCGIARWQPGSTREALLIERIVERAQRGPEEWRRRDSGLFSADEAG